MTAVLLFPECLMECVQLAQPAPQHGVRVFPSMDMVATMVAVLGHVVEGSVNAVVVPARPVYQCAPVSQPFLWAAPVVPILWHVVVDGSEIRPYYPDVSSGAGADIMSVGEAVASTTVAASKKPHPARRIPRRMPAKKRASMQTVQLDSAMRVCEGTRWERLPAMLPSAVAQPAHQMRDAQPDVVPQVIV